MVAGFNRRFKFVDDADYSQKKPWQPSNSYKIVALDGTGDYDDIQAAIDDTPSYGGTIFIKGGTYYLTSESITLKSNISLIGIGRATILDFNLIDGQTAISGTTISNISVENLLLRASGSGGFGIQLNGSSDIVLKNLWIEGNWTEGIRIISGSSKVLILNNLINALLNEIWLESSSYVIIQGNLIDGKSVAETGILLTTATYNIITQNIIINNGVNAIGNDTSTFLIIENNIFRTNGGNDIPANESQYAHNINSTGA